MQSRQLLILAAVAAAAIVAAFWAARERAPESAAPVGGPLVPGLEDHVNDITRIDVGTGGASLVTIERDDDAWRVAQKSGYPADVNQLRETLLGLSMAQVLEEKTSNPENYAQLGVGDDIPEDGAGAHLTITGLDQPVTLIVGEQARGGSSTYARRGGEATTLLVSGNLDVAKEPIEWLRREILDVTAASVQAVEIEHPDGRTLEIAKDEPGAADFKLAEIPEGRELVSAAEINALASAVTGLRLEDVERAEDFDPQSEDAVRATFRLFDGRVFDVHAFARDDRKMIHVQPGFDEALAERFAAPATADAGEATSGSAGDAPPQPEQEASGPAAENIAGDEAADSAPHEDEETAAGEPEAPGPAAEEASDASEDTAAAIGEARQQAESLQSRLEPWLFAVTDYKYELFTRAPEDLLQSPPEAETDTGAE
ncbi:hypothetical protein BH24PSE2_BH24PSE2_04370 [soil metagenome]